MATIVTPIKQAIHSITDVDATTTEANGPNKSPQSSEDGLGTSKSPKRDSIIDLLLLLSILFVPMLAISLVLLAFMFFSAERVVFENNGTPELPVNFVNVANDSYYTLIGPSKVALVSGWASHASFFVMPYFMILFSYCVAREVALNRPPVATIDKTQEIHDLLQGLLKGAWKEIWAWIKFTYQGKRSETPDDVRAVNLAAVGMMISFLFA
jgi:hypothetical protein